MGLVSREDPPIDVTPELVTISGEPRGALSQVEAHLSGDADDEPAADDETGSEPDDEELPAQGEDFDQLYRQTMAEDAGIGEGDHVGSQNCGESAFHA